MSAEMNTISMAQAINQALYRAMEKDETVVVLGEDVADPQGGVQKVTLGLSTKFGHDRVIDTAISEAVIMGAAAGAAIGGLRPVPEIMMCDFMTLAMDQLTNLAAKHYYTSGGRSSVPLTVRVGIVSKHTTGATHAQSLEAWFMHSPGLKVGIPSNPCDAKGMTASAILDDDPCILLETYSLYQKKGEVPVSDYLIPIGKAAIKREGDDVTLISYGDAFHACMDAAAQLADDGVQAEVIDLRWLAPMDMKTVLDSVGKTGRAVIVHNATEFCGPGAEISATLHKELFGKLHAPVERVAGPYVPIPSSPALEAAYFPCAESIISSVRTSLGQT